MKEIDLLIIGALISLISSAIGFCAQFIFSRFAKNRGKVKVYVKSVYNKTTSRTWGFDNSSSGMIFNVPLWVEIQNTKDKNEVVRNINLHLYSQGKLIGKTVQASHYGKDNEKIPYGKDGAYSFLLEPNSIKRYDLYFFVRQIDLNEKFDTVKISYYDLKDRKKEFMLFEQVANSWDISNNKIDEDWRLLK